MYYETLCILLQTMSYVNGQMLWGWGWLSWVSNPGPQSCETLAELGIKQMKCSERGKFNYLFLILFLTCLGIIWFL